MTTEAHQPVPAQVVGNAFAEKYYRMMQHSPEEVHKFYLDMSKLGRPEENGSMSSTTTIKAINEKILSLNYREFSTVINTVDAQGSHNGGVHVLVTGYVTGKDSTVRNFIQSFFLAPQISGYFVLNDMLRYVDNATVNSPLVNEAVVRVAAEPVSAPVEETKFPEKITPVGEELAAGDAYRPSENGDVRIVVEEAPVAEVVDEVPDAQMAVASNGKIEEMPKKSYASIVMHTQKSAATASPPPPPSGPQRASPKNVKQVIHATIPATDGLVSGSEPVDDGNNQEGEAEGYSIYIKGLPMNATEAMLEEVFKTFGDIKPNGIQVRSNRQQGFCFGFVEFEDAASVQKSLEASPVAIGARQCVCEEKKSTNNPRGNNNNRGRYQQPARNSGMRNEGGRVGNFGGGRRAFNNNNNDRGEFYGRRNFNNNYYDNRGEINGRSNFYYNNNNNDRGNRGRSDNFNRNGGRTMTNNHRNGTMPNGASKNNNVPTTT